MRQTQSILCWPNIPVLLGIWLVVQAAPAVSAEPSLDFGRQIVPLLREHCFRCHEGRDAPAGIRLDLLAELKGETGGDPLVVIGKSAQSRLLKAISSRDESLRMPPEGQPLAPAEVALIAHWIDAGLPWDANILPERDSPDEHWAFQPVKRPAIPRTKEEGWARTPIDRFIRAAQHARGVAPAKEASRRTLARRLFLDLWGLPPSSADVAAFEADERPDAVERLVDRLLDDPKYGERWGRHWLDVARWAESEGFESNHSRPFAWRYRDYVVQAFNDDKPFNWFLTQQVAGDELPDYTDENLIATGFLAAARISSNEEDKWLQKNDVTVDIVNMVGSALLGLTLHCAQCHDHKFDPITASDYYALHAFFARGLPLNVELNDAALRREHEQLTRPEYAPAMALQQTFFEEARKRLMSAVRAQLTPEEIYVYDLPPDARTPEEELLARRISLKFQKSTGEIERQIDPADRKLYDELKKRNGELAKLLPPVPQTFAFYSPVTSPHPLQVLPSIGFYPLPYEPQELARQRTYVMPRGDVYQLGPPVSPGIPEVLRRATGDKAGELAKTENVYPSAPADASADVETRASKVVAAFQSRRDLASWLTRPDHPLVPRVWVNRIWQWHFGRGLVATADDFGVRGARPTHPELLHWLAAEFVESGWSTKHVHRLIVLSATYRQSAEATPASYQLDPDNRWLTRFAPRRLEAEAIRDAWLQASGELDLTMGGPSVPLEQRETSLRRSLYLFQRRGHAPQAQSLFDGPQECASSTSRREVSTSPLQSLYLLNSAFSVDRARALAKKLRTEHADASPESLIRAAFEAILLRGPDADEMAAAVQLWKTGGQADALEIVCQSLLNLNEFTYLE